MANAGDRSGLDSEGAKTTYERLSNDRAPYIQRAETNAQYTIPSAFPKGSDNASTDYDTPYQSVGARGLNNMASKMLLSQFPVGDPFFKLTINEYLLKQVGDEEVVQSASMGLSLVERVAMRYLEGANFRPTAFEAMKQLLVCGNGMLFMPPGEQAVKLYRLQHYVIERDTIGRVLQGITKDEMAWITLPEEVQKVVDDPETPAEKVEVYTHFYLDPDDPDRYLSYQEVNDTVISGTENEFPKEALPWIPMRLFKIDGESYGRSFVEQYLGDLVSMENLSQSIVEFAQAASKVMFLVRPGGQTSARRLTRAKNGAFVAGNKEDIQVFQLEKYADFQVAEKVTQTLEQRLGMAFLLNSAVQRGGDRVTAEEIRYVANELEATLGGIYSVLSTEFQLPLIKRLLVDLQLTRKIPNLPKEAVEPTVITGLDAIGRGQDLDKLMQFYGATAPVVQFVQGEINWSNFVLRAAEATGLDSQGLLLTPEQRQQKQQEDAQAQAMQAAAQQGGAMAGANMGAAATDPEGIAAAVQQ